MNFSSDSSPLPPLFLKPLWAFSCPCPASGHYVFTIALILHGYPTSFWTCPTNQTDLLSCSPSFPSLRLSLHPMCLMVLALTQLMELLNLASNGDFGCFFISSLLTCQGKYWLNEWTHDWMNALSSDEPLTWALVSNSRCHSKAWETCPFRVSWTLDNCWVCSLLVVRTLKLLLVCVSCRLEAWSSKGSLGEMRNHFVLWLAARRPLFSLNPRKGRI